MAGRRAPQRTLARLAFPLLRRWRRLHGPPESGGVPRGIFREKDEIEAGRVEGGVLADGQQLPALPPDSEIAACGLGQADFGDWTALWTRRANARLLGKSLVHLDAAGRASHEAMFGVQAPGDPVWKPRPKQAALELPGNWTSLVSRWDHGTNYYHWLTDALTRVIHLPEFPPDTGILLRSGIARFAEDSLRRLGLWDRVRLVESGHEHLLVEHYHFAGPLALSGCVNPLGTTWLRRSFAVPERAGHRKVFILRRGTTRGVLNLAELESALKAEGWDTVDPGSLSFAEQLAIFGEARVIGGIHGAGMTNILWAPPGTRVLELMPRSFRNGCYEALSLVAGHDHRVILCPSDPAGMISVPREALRQVLEAAG